MRGDSIQKVKGHEIPKSIYWFEFYVFQCPISLVRVLNLTVDQQRVGLMWRACFWTLLMKTWGNVPHSDYLFARTHVNTTSWESMCPLCLMYQPWCRGPWAWRSWPISMGRTNVIIPEWPSTRMIPRSPTYLSPALGRTLLETASSIALVTPPLSGMTSVSLYAWKYL